MLKGVYFSSIFLFELQLHVIESPLEQDAISDTWLLNLRCCTDFEMNAVLIRGCHKKKAGKKTSTISLTQPLVVSFLDVSTKKHYHNFDK